MSLLNFFKKTQNNSQETPQSQNATSTLKFDHITSLTKGIHQYFGPIDRMFHSSSDNPIYIQVVEIPAHNQADFVQLITVGSCAYKMPIPNPDFQEQYQYAEFIMWLPKDWDVASGDLEKNWPLNILIHVASQACKHQGYMSPGAIVQMDPSGNPLPGSQTPFSHCLIVPGHTSHGGAATITMANEDIINFYHVIPLTPAEYQFYESHGYQAILQKFAESKLSLVIDPRRESLI